jgi:UDP-GlcNAc:undecaprenyl-phosphate GlcNAc-1-phosphate transferase
MQVVLFAAAGAVTMMLIMLLERRAAAIGLVDQPSGRKRHCRPTPVVGGLAMFGGFVIVSMAQTPIVSGLEAFLGAALLIVVTGALDDRFELTARLRLLIQGSGALLIAWWGGAALGDLGPLFGNTPLALGMFAIPFAMFCTVGIINAVNMTDGVDGLAAGLCAIAFAALAYLAAQSGNMVDANLLVQLVAVIIAFLIFNARSPWRRRARVFMGDAGSTFLGLALAWFLIRLSQGDDRVIQPVTALWLCALPLIDSVGVMLRRIAQGKSPFGGDRQHLHYILLDHGFSVGETVTLLWLIGGVLACVGVVGQLAQVPDAVMSVGFVGLWGGYLVLLKHAPLLKHWSTEVAAVWSGRADLMAQQVDSNAAPHAEKPTSKAPKH